MAAAENSLMPCVMLLARLSFGACLFFTTSCSWLRALSAKGVGVRPRPVKLLLERRSCGWDCSRLPPSPSGPGGSSWGSSLSSAEAALRRPVLCC